MAPCLFRTYTSLRIQGKYFFFREALYDHCNPKKGSASSVIQGHRISVSLFQGPYLCLWLRHVGVRVFLPCERASLMTISAHCCKPSAQPCASLTKALNNQLWEEGMPRGQAFPYAWNQPCKATQSSPRPNSQWLRGPTPSRGNLAIYLALPPH